MNSLAMRPWRQAYLELEAEIRNLYLAEVARREGIETSENEMQNNVEILVQDENDSLPKRAHGSGYSTVNVRRSSNSKSSTQTLAKLSTEVVVDEFGNTYVLDEVGNLQSVEINESGEIVSLNPNIMNGNINVNNNFRATVNHSSTGNLLPSVSNSRSDLSTVQKGGSSHRLGQQVNQINNNSSFVRLDSDENVNSFAYNHGVQHRGSGENTSGTKHLRVLEENRNINPYNNFNGGYYTSQGSASPMGSEELDSEYGMQSWDSCSSASSARSSSVQSSSPESEGDNGSDVTDSGDFGAFAHEGNSTNPNNNRLSKRQTKSSRNSKKHLRYLSQHARNINALNSQVQGRHVHFGSAQMNGSKRIINSNNVGSPLKSNSVLAVPSIAVNYAPSTESSENEGSGRRNGRSASRSRSSGRNARKSADGLSRNFSEKAAKNRALEDAMNESNRRISEDNRRNFNKRKSLDSSMRENSSTHGSKNRSSAGENNINLSGPNSPTSMQTKSPRGLGGILSPMSSLRPSVHSMPGTGNNTHQILDHLLDHSPRRSHKFDNPASILAQSTRAGGAALRMMGGSNHNNQVIHNNTITPGYHPPMGGVPRIVQQQFIESRGMRQLSPNRNMDRNMNNNMNINTHGSTLPVQVLNIPDSAQLQNQLPFRSSNIRHFTGSTIQEDIEGEQSHSASPTPQNSESPESLREAEIKKSSYVRTKSDEKSTYISEKTTSNLTPIKVPGIDLNGVLDSTTSFVMENDSPDGSPASRKRSSELKFAAFDNEMKAKRSVDENNSKREFPTVKSSTNETNLTDLTKEMTHGSRKTGYISKDSLRSSGNSSGYNKLSGHFKNSIPVIIEQKHRSSNENDDFQVTSQDFHFSVQPGNSMNGVNSNVFLADSNAKNSANLSASQKLSIIDMSANSDPTATKNRLQQSAVLLNTSNSHHTTPSHASNITANLFAKSTAMSGVYGNMPATGRGNSDRSAKMRNVENMIRNSQNLANRSTGSGMNVDVSHSNHPSLRGTAPSQLLGSGGIMVNSNITPGHSSNSVNLPTSSSALIMPNAQSENFSRESSRRSSHHAMKKLSADMVHGSMSPLLAVNGNAPQLSNQVSQNSNLNLPNMMGIAGSAPNSAKRFSAISSGSRRISPSNSKTSFANISNANSVLSSNAIWFDMTKNDTKDMSARDVSVTGSGSNNANNKDINLTSSNNTNTSNPSGSKKTISVRDQASRAIRSIAASISGAVFPFSNTKILSNETSSDIVSNGLGDTEVPMRQVNEDEQASNEMKKKSSNKVSAETMISLSQKAEQMRYSQHSQKLAKKKHSHNNKHSPANAISSSFPLPPRAPSPRGSESENITGYETEEMVHLNESRKLKNAGKNDHNEKKGKKHSKGPHFLHQKSLENQNSSSMLINASQPMSATFHKHGNSPSQNQSASRLWSARAVASERLMTSAEMMQLRNTEVLKENSAMNVLNINKNSMSQQNANVSSANLINKKSANNIFSTRISRAAKSSSKEHNSRFSGRNEHSSNNKMSKESKDSKNSKRNSKNSEDSGDRRVSKRVSRIDEGDEHNGKNQNSAKLAYLSDDSNVSPLSPRNLEKLDKEVAEKVKTKKNLTSYATGRNVPEQKVSTGKKIAMSQIVEENENESQFQKSTPSKAPSANIFHSRTLPVLGNLAKADAEAIPPGKRAKLASLIPSYSQVLGADKFVIFGDEYGDEFVVPESELEQAGFVEKVEVENIGIGTTEYYGIAASHANSTAHTNKNSKTQVPLITHSSSLSSEKRMFGPRDNHSPTRESTKESMVGTSKNSSHFSKHGHRKVRRAETDGRAHHYTTNNVHVPVSENIYINNISNNNTVADKIRALTTRGGRFVSHNNSNQNSPTYKYQNSPLASVNLSSYSPMSKHSNRFGGPSLTRCQANRGQNNLYYGFY